MSYCSRNKENLDGEFDNLEASPSKSETLDLRFMDEEGRYSDSGTLNQAQSSRKKRREDYRSHFRHERSESHREKKHSHRDKHHRDRRHSSREREKARYHRKKHAYETETKYKSERDHSKGNLLGSKYSDSCKYDVQKVKDFRNSNRDSENHRKYERDKRERTVPVQTIIEKEEPSAEVDDKKLSDILEADLQEEFGRGNDEEMEDEDSPAEKRPKLDNKEEETDSSTETNPNSSGCSEKSEKSPNLEQEKDQSPVSPINEESNQNAEEEEEEETKPEFDETLPPYYPAIEGCRSLDEFQCLNRIAEGTYGVVYRFKDKRTDDIVALKKLKMEKEKEGFPITSLREINTLLKGQHPNIVTVREIVVGSNMDKIFIVMDYVEHDLKSLIEMMKRKDQHFTPGEVKCLLKQLLEAVAHLHDNWILHRDLKTSNLLLSHKGILKVGDFGLAREYGSPLRPYTPIVVTLWYRAPELLLCTKQYSTPVDMWSVGCIFAEFLLMSAIFPGKSEVEQLNRIFKCLGTPSEKIWPGYNKLPAVQKMKFTNHSMSNLRKKFQMLSDLGLNFLLNFLTYDPNQRISADEALKHPYFSEFPAPIDPSMFPKWPAKSELNHKRAAAASPKPPSGGGEYKKLGDEDGFRIGLETDNSRIGAGFSLKF